MASTRFQVNGALLEQSRRDAGLTHKELGERAGVAASAISHYENGKRSPGAVQLAAICEVLGLQVEDVMVPDDEDMREDIRRLVDDWPPLTPAQRARLAAIVASARTTRSRHSGDGHEAERRRRPERTKAQK
jgi:transcriptional regulator with XRE-family HTH domain